MSHELDLKNPLELLFVVEDASVVSGVTGTGLRRDSRASACPGRPSIASSVVREVVC